MRVTQGRNACVAEGARMITVFAGNQDDNGTEAAIVMATALDARGHRVGVDVRTLPARLTRSHKFDLVDLAIDMDQEGLTPDHVLVTSAGNLSPTTLLALRSASLKETTHVAAFGRFADRQAEIGAAARIAHAVGREPLMLDLAEFQRPSFRLGAHSALPTVPLDPIRVGPPDVLVILTDDSLSDDDLLQPLGALDRRDAINLHVVATSKVRDRIAQSPFAGLRLYSYAQLAPLRMARWCSLAIVIGAAASGERLLSFALNLMRAGGVLADGTDQATFLSAGAPAITGPRSLRELPAFIERDLVQNLGVIGRQAAQSTWLPACTVERLEEEIGMSPEEPAKTPRETARTLFIPTNGIGLGHARRCTLIASELEEPPAFAAFPSCLGLISTAGFSVTPLVQRSDDHSESYANDLLNYRRLSHLCAHGDTLVFDGGYIFEMIHRTILDHRLFGVWIRRGLWQAEHTVRFQNERARVFDLIISPDEAFPELNEDDPQVEGAFRRVGPIVDAPATPARDTEARDRIMERFGRSGGRLIVSLLGSGVVVDRAAQLQTIASIVERRDDCLHLVVVWPGSQIAPSLQGWSNTKVVSTTHGARLSEMADFVISAAGYNSFHELLYSGVPSMFIPQNAPIMDDQQRRAEAAVDRGLAVLVQPHELLLLERKLLEFLDTDAPDQLRSRLREARLPKPGTADAARLIAEVGR